MCLLPLSPLGRAENADRVVVDHLEVHLVAAQIADVVEAVLDHRRPLQAQTVAGHAHVPLSRARPISSNISGRNRPELPISTHFFKPLW